MSVRQLECALLPSLIHTCRWYAGNHHMADTSATAKLQLEAAKLAQHKTHDQWAVGHGTWQTLLLLRQVVCQPAKQPRAPVLPNIVDGTKLHLLACRKATSCSVGGRHAECCQARHAPTLTQAVRLGEAPEVPQTKMCCTRRLKPRS